jgi:RNA-directed DNA polymerase
MSAMEKSEVAKKQANKTVSAVSEPAERMGGAKENAELQSTVRTQSREAVSQAQLRLREAVTGKGQEKLPCTSCTPTRTRGSHASLPEARLRRVAA